MVNVFTDNVIETDMQRVVSKDNPITNFHNRMRGLVLSTQITKTLIGQNRNVLFVYAA